VFSKVKVFYGIRGKIKGEKDKIYLEFLEIFELTEIDRHVLLFWSAGISEFLLANKSVN
jgi:hypothetical protein